MVKESYSVIYFNFNFPHNSVVTHVDFTLEDSMKYMVIKMIKFCMVILICYHIDDAISGLNLIYSNV